MNDRNETIGRAADLLRYLQALHRDARAAGPGSPAADRWKGEMIRQFPRLMELLAESCGIELPR